MKIWGPLRKVPEFLFVWPIVFVTLVAALFHIDYRFALLSFGFSVVATAIPATLFAHWLSQRGKLVRLSRMYGSNYFFAATMDSFSWAMGFAALLYAAAGQLSAEGILTWSWDQATLIAAAFLIVSIMCCPRWLNAMAAESSVPPPFKTGLARPGNVADSILQVSLSLAVFGLTMGASLGETVSELGHIVLIVLPAHAFGVFLFTVIVSHHAQQLGRPIPEVLN